MTSWRKRDADEVLASLAAVLERHGGHPTYERIAEELGYAGPAGARAAVMRLASMGLVSVDRGRISIIGDAGGARVPSRDEVTRALEAGPATPDELAERLGAPAAVVDGALRRMARRGLVEQCWRLRA